MGRSEEEGEGHVQIYTHDSRHRLLQQVGSCRPFVENKQMPENKERTHTSTESIFKESGTMERRAHDESE